MINGLDLFSGIGAFGEALAPWVRPVAYCEIERHAQSVLLERMAAGDLHVAPIWDDVRTLHADALPGVDLIYGGFPCQDLSCAGAGKGLEGERSGLFFEIVRLIGECRPAFVFLENVPAISVRGLDRVLLELHSLGYDARWTVVSAEEVGAPFLGERWFLLAKAVRSGHWDLDQQESKPRGDRQADPGGDCQTVAAAAGVGRGEGRAEREQLGRAEAIGDCSPLGEPNGARLERAEYARKTWAAFAEHRHSSERDWPSWLPKPALPRGHDGLAMRMERIRESGNAVVWLQAEEAFKRLLGMSGQHTLPESRSSIPSSEKGKAE